MNPSEKLIAEIRQFCHKRMPIDRVDEVVDEVRAHLDESIQSRLELGSSFENAEAAAVAAFGSPRRFVEQVTSIRRNVRSPLFDQRVWWALVITTVATAAYALFIFHSQFVMNKTLPFLPGLLSFAAAIGCVYLIWRSSWRAPQLQLLPIFANWVLGTLLFALVWSTTGAVDLYMLEGTGASKSSIRDGIRRMNLEAETWAREEAEFRAAERRYQLGDRGGKLIKPVWHGLTARLTFEPAKNQADVDLAWKGAAPRANEFYKRVPWFVRETQDHDAEMLRRPFWLNTIYYLPEGAKTSLIWCGLTGAISFCAWFIREFIAMVKNFRGPSRRSTA